MADLLLTNIGRLVTMSSDAGVIENATVLCRGNTIQGIGRSGEVPPVGKDEVIEHLDCGQAAVLPGLIDSHTHLVFGGDRANEFALRSSGVSYEEIARQGGGIKSTVKATRQSSVDQLVELALPRLNTMLSHGVTTVEIKSGYGLDLESELKMLQVASRLKQEHPVNIVTTFLGAHTIPAEYQGRANEYVNLVCDEMIPAVAENELAQFCDVFCEVGSFTVEQSRRVLETGRKHGLLPKIHSEQLNWTGGTALGAELEAVSVDHLEHATTEDIEALSASGKTTAVLIPGCTLYLGLNDWAPARQLLDAGVRVALATDCNPGSCMCDNLPLITTLACTRLGMSPDEALRGVTINAAHAVGVSEMRGSIEVGKVADFLIMGAHHEHQMPYKFGAVRPRAVVASGKVVIGPGFSVCEH